MPRADDARRVLVDHVYLAAAAQLLHLLEVAGRHDEDQVGFGDDCRRELAGAVTGQVEIALHPDEQRFVGRGQVVPRIGARARRRSRPSMPRRSAILARKRFGHRAPAGVAAADEKQVHRSGVPDEIGNAFAQLCAGIAPGRITRGSRPVQSTTVEGCGLLEPPAVEHAERPARDRVAPLRDDLIGGGRRRNARPVRARRRDRIAVRQNQTGQRRVRRPPDGNSALGSAKPVGHALLAAGKHQRERTRPDSARRTSTRSR